MFATHFVRCAARPLAVAVVCAAGAVVAPAAQAFNPQPDPPGRYAITASMLTPRVSDDFNPQPEPPGHLGRAGLASA